LLGLVTSEQEWQRYSSNGKCVSTAKHSTPTQTLKQAALLEAYHWFFGPGSLITSDLISKSFKVMGISNALM
jgi:hypothetical protein